MCECDSVGKCGSVCVSVTVWVSEGQYVGVWECG